jgi:protein ImuB
MRLASLFLPRFPVQRRVLEQPSLAGKPLVLHRDERGTQRLRFTSSAARRRGLAPGQTLAAATALVPEVARAAVDEAVEVAALRRLAEGLLPLAPGFQVDGPEGLWLDASAAHLSGGEQAWAERVLAACRQLGFAGRCVVGSERFTTQALARSGPPGTAEVVEPGGGGALARLPLASLEEGWLGPGAAAPFRALGLSTLGELQGLAPGALVARFGAAGLQAARLCRGDDDSRFAADVLPEILEETVQLDWPAELLEPVLFALKMVIDRLCARLQGRRQAAVRLTATVCLDGAPSLSVPLVLARPSSQGRLLLELTRHRLTDLTVRNPITALSMRVESSSADQGRQLVLGDEPAGEAALEVVLSRLQSALGEEALFSAQPVAQHRPEASWTATRFAPPVQGAPAPTEAPPLLEAPASRPPPRVRPRQQRRPAAREGAEPEAIPWPRRKAKVELRPLVSLPAMSTRPPRLFREPARLAAELTEAGALSWLDVAGRRRRVESIWGPERLVGAWWEEGFSRDYYRVQLEGVGTLWVFRDGRDGAFYAQGVFD